MDHNALNSYALALAQRQEQRERIKREEEMRELFKGPRNRLYDFIYKRIGELHSATTGEPIPPANREWGTAPRFSGMFNLKDAAFRAAVTAYSVFIISLIDAERDRCLRAVSEELERWNMGGEFYADVTDACDGIVKRIGEGR